MDNPSRNMNFLNDKHENFPLNYILQNAKLAYDINFKQISIFIMTYFP